MTAVGRSSGAAYEGASLRQRSTHAPPQVRSRLEALAVCVCAPAICYYVTNAGVTRVVWPPGDEAASDLALLVQAQVVAADADACVEFPHRTIQEYFAASGVLEATVHKSDGISRTRSMGGCQHADDLFLKWSPPSPPRDAVLSVLLSLGASNQLKQWSLTSPAWDDWRDHLRELCELSIFLPSPAPPSVSPLLVRAASNPSNNFFRHVLVATCTKDPCTCNILASAVAFGCAASQFTDLMGDCIQYSSCAADLWCSKLFATAATMFWHLAPFSRASELLGSRFWTLADAVTGGEQSKRSIRILGATADTSCQLARHDDVLDRERVAIVVLRSILRCASPEYFAEARRVLERASTSTTESIAAEAALALASLEPPVAWATSCCATAYEGAGLRERLLLLASSTTSPSATVRRVTVELANRFSGDVDVRAGLRAAIMRDGMSHFVDACVTGLGLCFVSTDIALELFMRVPPPECTRLASRMWDPTADAEAAVAEALTPLHIAAARKKAVFVETFLDQCGGDLRAVNCSSNSGSTPLDHADCIECITVLLDAGAVCGRPRPGTPTSLHYAAKNGSVHLVRRLLAAGAPATAIDEVRSGGVLGVEFLLGLFSRLHQSVC